MRDYLFTSESVSEGHPDKVCDQIADAVLDDILAADRAARVACEVIANTGLVMVFGEITTSHYCDFEAVARGVLARIGYLQPLGFSAESCAVLSAVKAQSPDICGAVDSALEARNGSGDPLDAQGAGDQGIMFGYASAESEEHFPGAFMPLPILLAQRLAQRLALLRRSGDAGMLRPDAKTQVTLRYTAGRPVAVETVLISTQHEPGTDQAALAALLRAHCVEPVIPAALQQEELRFLCNPSGIFERGGPEADSGLTGRKLIVDTYGGSARHGGGSFSGKDPSKVDRSASYYARYAAKNLIAAGAAERLELQVSYAIGAARPVSISVDCFGTARVAEERIEALLRDGEVFDFRPAAITRELDLLTTRYQAVAAYGHFGRSDIELPWERLDKVDALRQALAL